jgi:hypothetical protein
MDFQATGSGSTDLIQSGSETLFTVPLTVCVFTLTICIITHVQPSGEEEEDVATSPRKKKPAAGGGRASDGDEVETIQGHSLSDTMHSHQPPDPHRLHAHMGYRTW